MSDRQAGQKAILTTPGEREIRTERVIGASRERVFAAYIDPELIPRWWGPRGTTTRVEELDARPGGRWQFAIVNSDGSEVVFRGVFREVTAPERISWTFEWDGLPGYPSVDTSTLEDLGDRTRIVTETIFHTPEERDGMIAGEMERGMNETYDRLEELLADM